MVLQGSCYFVYYAQCTELASDKQNMYGIDGGPRILHVMPAILEFLQPFETLGLKEVIVV